MVRAWWRSSKYQFYSLWIDLTGARTHDLRIWDKHANHYTTDAVLNWINKHRWSVECCQQKHEIIFTNRSLFVWDATLLTKCVYAFKKWRQLSFYYSYPYISFRLILFSSVICFNVKVRMVFQVYTVGISNYFLK